MSSALFSKRFLSYLSVLLGVLLIIVVSFRSNWLPIQPNRFFRAASSGTPTIPADTGILGGFSERALPLTGGQDLPASPTSSPTMNPSETATVTVTAEPVLPPPQPAVPSSTATNIPPTQTQQASTPTLQPTLTSSPTSEPSPTTEPLPTEAPPPESPGTITIGQSGQSLSADCSGADVIVEGNNNDITLTGACSSLTVTGNHNRIDIEFPTSVTDTGNNNIIE